MPVPPSATTDSERMGDMLLQANKLDEALLQYDIARDEGADRASVAFRTGFVYLAKARWQEALDWFSVSIATDPTMTLAYEGAGKASLELGHLRNAAAFFEGAVQHSPGYWVPHVYLGAIYKAMGMDSQSQEHMELAKSQVEAGDNSIYMTMAVAQRRVEYAVEQHPDEAEDYEGFAAREQPSREPTTAAGEAEEAEASAQGSRDDVASHELPAVLPPAGDQAAETPAAEEPDAGDAAVEVEAAEETPAEETPVEETPVAETPAEVAAAEPAVGSTPAEDAAAVSSVDQDALQAALLAVSEESAAENREGVPAAFAEEHAGGDAATPPSAEGAVTVSGGGPVTPAASETPSAAETPPAAAEPEEAHQEVASLAPSGYNYSILESSWRTEEEARVRTADLLNRGVTANIVPVNLPEKGLWYRVMIGEFANLDVAERMKTKLITDFGLSHLNILRDGRFFQTVE